MPSSESASPFEHPVVAGLDRAAEAVAAGARGRPIVDRTLYALSRAGEHSLLWHGINVLDAVANGEVGRRRALRRSVVLVAEQALVNGPIKMAFGRGRPAHVEDHPHGLRTPRTSSFPSGHASAGACAAQLLTTDLGAAPLWYGLAAAVAWSRIHVGAHHASDVVGGAFVGTALGALAGRVWPPPHAGTGSGRYRGGDASR